MKINIKIYLVRERYIELMEGINHKELLNNIEDLSVSDMIQNAKDLLARYRDKESPLYVKYNDNEKYNAWKSHTRKLDRFLIAYPEYLLE